MIEAALLELYESSCTLRPVTGHRRDGMPAYGAPETERCHLEVQNRRTVNAAGDEVTAAGRVHLTVPRTDITEEWQIALPGGATPRIVAVETTYGLNLDTGENGPYQTLIYYGG